MYIRIEQDEIRFRVSRLEAEALINGQVISHNCGLSEEFRLTYSVESIEQPSIFEFDKGNAELRLMINFTELQSELTTRPTKKGIVFHQPTDGKNLQVSLEIDLKKTKLKQPKI